MPFIENRLFGLDVARGLISGITSVNKFGSAPDGVQTTLTDIWSRANATPTQPIWLAPTAARIHALVSSSALDTGFNVTVYGLKTWDSAETNEVIAMNGATPVNTVNSYVIIHRMIMTPTAAKVTNAGIISATAAVDSTITAVIDTGDAQTEMAIYGVPSTKTAYLMRWNAQVDRASTQAVTADIRFLLNPNPNIQTTGFIRKDDITLQSTGQNAHERVYTIPPKYAGPCIIKIAGIGSANDIDAESGFDLILIDN